MKFFATLFVSLLVSFAAFAESDRNGVVTPDGIPWDFPETSGGFVAIGDIHGDADALVTILRDRGLIDEQENWIGGKTRLVLMGDLVDRGPQTRRVMDLVMKLIKQASLADGSVHALVGNHELMVTEGDLRYVAPEDARAFSDFGADPIRAAFKAPSPYAQWIGSRNSMIRIGRTLFVHAGLEPWGVTAPALNATVRAWLRFHQGEGAKPPRKTEWVKHDHGPLWTRAMAVGGEHGEVSAADLQKLLDFYNVDRVIMGHSIQDGLEAKHARYGKKALFIDTGISSAYGGLLSSIAMKGDALDFREIPRYEDDPVFAKRQEQLKNERSIKSRISACFRAVVGR